MFGRLASLAFAVSLSASLAACTADSTGNEPHPPANPALRVHRDESLPPDPQAQLGVVYPVDESINGRDLRSYANEYIGWYTSIAKSRHPALGGDCNIDQDDEHAFFLAGSMAEGKYVHTCHVKQSKRAIFVPVLAALARPCPETAGCATPHTPEELESAIGDALVGAQVKVEIDGVALKDDAIGQVETTDLTLYAPADSSEQIVACTGAVPKNDCGIKEGNRNGAATMYAAMLRPLGRGSHVVHVVGKLPTGEAAHAVVDVTWSIHVD